MELEVEWLTGATYGEKSQDRLVQRNGYRAWIWKTRTGSVELRIPRSEGKDGSWECCLLPPDEGQSIAD
jgi:transposase-like protein